MNNIKDNLIENSNKLYRKSFFTDDLYTAVAIIFEEILKRLDEAEKQLFFDTMTETGIEIFEKYLGISSPSAASIEEKRKNVAANWLAARGKKFTLQMITDLCLAWDKGKVEVTFIGGKIKIAFMDLYGVPPFIEQLRKTIDRIKPAHLPYEFIYQLHTWGDVATHKWNFYQNETWEWVRGGQWTNGN